MSCRSYRNVKYWVDGMSIVEKRVYMMRDVCVHDL